MREPAGCCLTRRIALASFGFGVFGALLRLAAPRLLELFGFLTIGSQLHVFLVRLLCRRLVLQFLGGLAESQIGLGQVRVPLRRLLVAAEGSAVIVLLEILVADADVLLRLQGIEPVLPGLKRLVLFRRLLLLLLFRRR